MVKLRIMMIEKSNIKQRHTKRNKIIVLLIYILSTILYILYSGGVLLLTEECRFFKYTEETLLRKFEILFFVAYSILASIYLIKKDYRFIISFIIPLFAYTSVWIIMDRKFERKLENEKSIVTKASVIHNSNSSRGINGVSVEFKIRERKETTTINAHVQTDGIGSGDTILIKYLESCNYVVGLYEAYPTQFQLEQCKNDCYLMNGKLTPVNKE